MEKAQTFQIDVNTALIPPEALDKGRQNQLIEDGTYPGLEAALDDVEEREKQMAEEFDIPEGPTCRTPPAGSRPAHRRRAAGASRFPARVVAAKAVAAPSRSPARLNLTAAAAAPSKTPPPKAGLPINLKIGTITALVNRHSASSRRCAGADAAVRWPKTIGLRTPTSTPANIRTAITAGGRRPAAVKSPPPTDRGDRVRVAAGPHEGAVGIVRTTVRGSAGTRHFVRFDKPSAGKVGEAFTPQQLVPAHYARPAVPTEQAANALRTHRSPRSRLFAAGQAA